LIFKFFTRMYSSIVNYNNCLLCDCIGKQIKDKKYHEKYLDQTKEIYLVGIEFDESEKNISNFEWEKID